MAGVMTPAGITIRRGDSFDILMNFKAGNKNFDLTECQLKMTVRDSDNNELFSKEGEIISAAAGTARIKLTPAETDANPGNYQTDIQIIFKNGDVHTIYPQNVNAVAYFKLTPEVTL